jgi:hypothetical protein
MNNNKHKRSTFAIHYEKIVSIVTCPMQLKSV